MRFELLLYDQGWVQSWTLGGLIVEDIELDLRGINCPFHVKSFLTLFCYRKYCRFGGHSPGPPLDLPLRTTRTLKIACFERY